MRVIAGSARSVQLRTIEGMDTRPTTDRTKETLFNIIHNDLYDCTFLDLYSGSGAIGIEALSRDAKYAIFVENNNEAVQCIKDNLDKTKLKDRGRVINGDVLFTLRQLSEQKEKFDYIFLDPPYNKGHEESALEIIAQYDVLLSDTTIIIETSDDKDLSSIETMGFEVVRIKKYKTNQHVFLHKK